MLDELKNKGTKGGTWTRTKLLCTNADSQGQGGAQECGEGKGVVDTCIS